MKYPIKTILITAAAIGLLTGCANTNTGMPAPQLTFANFQPVVLNAQSSAVVEAYINPNDPQDISGQFIVAPADAIKRYAARRFPASGAGSGLFTITIEDARVHMRELLEDNKVLQWSGVGKEDEYRLFLRLKVTTVPDGTSSRASTTIKMERTLVMPSSVTLQEREIRQVNFLEKMMVDVDTAILKAIDETPSMR